MNVKKILVNVFGSVFCVSMLVSNLYAQGAAPQQSPLGSLFPLIVIFGIFYFLLIRPQQKKAKDHQVMLSGLKKDDKVITNGGLHGSIVGVKGDVVEVKIAEGVRVQLSKSAVSNIAPAAVENAVVTPEVVK